MNRKYARDGNRQLAARWLDGQKMFPSMPISDGCATVWYRSRCWTTGFTSTLPASYRRWAVWDCSTTSIRWRRGRKWFDVWSLWVWPLSTAWSSTPPPRTCSCWPPDSSTSTRPGYSRTSASIYSPGWHRWPRKNLEFFFLHFFPFLVQLGSLQM